MNIPQPTGQKPALKILSSLRLKFRLIGDPRVSIWLKLAFFAGFLWVIFPDLIIGPLDDAFVLWFLATWENYCPPGVVKEHREQLIRERRQNV